MSNLFDSVNIVSLSAVSFSSNPEQIFQRMDDMFGDMFVWISASVVSFLFLAAFVSLLSFFIKGLL